MIGIMDVIMILGLEKLIRSIFIELNFIVQTYKDEEMV